MSLSTLRLTLGAGLLAGIASSLPTNYIANSAKTIDVTLPRCSNTTGHPATYCFMHHTEIPDKPNNRIIDIEIPKFPNTAKIIADINKLAVDSHLTFEEILASLHPTVEIKDTKGLNARFEAPTRDANGEIIVGLGDNQWTQTEEQRETLDKEEQKEKDAEDPIFEMERNRAAGAKYGDGQFTSNDAEREQLDKKEQKEIDALNKKIAKYNEKKAQEEASENFINVLFQRRSL